MHKILWSGEISRKNFLGSLEGAIFIGSKD